MAGGWSSDGAVQDQIDASVAELPIGSPVEAQILLAQDSRGIVVPETALVDDGGVPVVYLQIGGESFVRAEVSVAGRQSGRVLVEGLPPGARVVAVPLGRRRTAAGREPGKAADWAVALRQSAVANVAKVRYLAGFD